MRVRVRARARARVKIRVRAGRERGLRVIEEGVLAPLKAVLDHAWDVERVVEWTDEGLRHLDLRACMHAHACICMPACGYVCVRAGGRRGCGISTCEPIKQWLRIVQNRSSMHLPGIDHMGPRAGEHEGHMGARAGECGAYRAGCTHAPEWRQHKHPTQSLGEEEAIHEPLPPAVKVKVRFGLGLGLGFMGLGLGFMGLGLGLGLGLGWG